MDASASVKCPSACHSGSLMAFQSMKRGNTRGGLLAGPPGAGGGGTKVPGKEPRVRNRRLELSCQLVLLYDLEPSLSLAEPHFPHVDSEAAAILSANKACHCSLLKVGHASKYKTSLLTVSQYTDCVPYWAPSFSPRQSVFPSSHIDRPPEDICS